MKTPHRFGSHLSIAGGYYKAIESAAELQLATVQIFTKNNNQWKAKELTDDDIRLFNDARQRTGVDCACSHSSYLINLGSPADELWERSIEALGVELERAEALSIPGVVVHPGSGVGSSEDEAIRRIVKGIDRVHQKMRGVACQIWLETTAGQGTSIGHTFEQIAAILGMVKAPERIGVCVDTCHIFAAGYSFATPTEYAGVFEQFDELIGLEKIRAFHLNDSKKPLGSRVDRHEHIGEGQIGDKPFRLLLKDSRFVGIPMILETEKGERDGEALDAINLRRLRKLCK